MGKVNVVLPSGQVVSVDEEVARQSQLPGPSHEQGAAIAGQQIDEQRANNGTGILEKVPLLGALPKIVGDTEAATYGEGFADAATFGGYGKLAGLIDPDYAHEMALRGEQHPWMRAAGELTTIVAPTGAPGLASKAGKAVEGALLAEEARPLTRGAELLAKTAGRATEGALIGGGSHVASTNITGDPLTIEGTLASMGTGTVLNVGLGAAADKLMSAGAKAETTALESNALKSDFDTVKEGRELFKNPPDSWETLKSTIKKAADDENSIAKEALKSAKKYEEFAAGEGLRKEINKTENTINKISRYWRDDADPFDSLPGKTYHHYSLRPEPPEVPQGRSNPMAGGSGPRGVYTWPEDAQVVTFGKDRPYKFDLKAKGKVLDTSEYTSQQLERDLQTLEREGVDVKKSREMWQKYKSNYSAPDKPFSELWFTVTKGYKPGLSAEDFAGWSAPGVTDADEATKLMQKLGHTAVEDKLGILYSSEPHQAAFFSNDAFAVRQPKPAGAEGGRMPISDEMKATLKDYRDRLRRIDQLRVGGYDVDASKTAGRWVKGDVPADPRRAVEELRALRAEMERFPKATRTSNWKDLPEMPPRDVPAPEDFKVPKDFRELYSMGPERAQRISNLIGKDPAAQAAFERLAGELGVDAADGLAGLNAKLGKYIQADKRLAEYAKKEAEGDGLLAFLRRGAKKFVRAGSARAADVALGGGWMGIGGRVLAGEGVGAAMNKLEDAVSGAMMRNKLATRSALSTMFSKAAPPLSKAVRELGPITAYLQQNLLTGEKDSGDDLTELAVRRINEAASANINAPDAAYVALQSLLGMPGDVAWKMHRKIVGDVQHLVDAAPKDPGIAFHGLRSDWSPSHEEALAFAYRIEAVTNPLKAIARSISGDGHPAAVETLWARWPALMQAASEEFAFSLHDMRGMSYEQASNYSHVFRTPITGLMDPNVGLTLQGIYMQSAAPPQQSGPAPSRAPTGNPVGRPAAVQSQVAGSSVAGLIQ